jgi:transposase-like protein
MPTRSRRHFSRVYKVEGVRAPKRAGDVSQTARDLGISANLVHRWKRELRDDEHRASGKAGAGHLCDQ